MSNKKRTQKDYDIWEITPIKETPRKEHPVFNHPYEDDGTNKILVRLPRGKDKLILLDVLECGTFLAWTETRWNGSVGERNSQTALLGYLRIQDQVKKKHLQIGDYVVDFKLMIEVDTKNGNYITRACDIEFLPVITKEQ